MWVLRYEASALAARRTRLTPSKKAFRERRLCLYLMCRPLAFFATI